MAAVFRSTAEGETGHAHGHLEYMEVVGDPATGLPIGTTGDNLKAAIAGETHEYTDMYPGMAKTARDEGFEEIADWFETLAKAERSQRQPLPESSGRDGRLARRSIPAPGRNGVRGAPPNSIAKKVDRGRANRAHAGRQLGGAQAPAHRLALRILL